MMGRIEPYNSMCGTAIAGVLEDFGVDAASGTPLSGYLAGKERGGEMVCALEDLWQETFNVRNAIACNSATSSLMAAAFAVGLGPGDQFACPALTMSATCAAPMFTGATPVFCDVNDYFAMAGSDAPTNVKAVFLTHLFGIAFDESWWRGWTHQNGIKLVVDAAQSPFAKEARSDRFAGTIGDIGVFSLNVHKHFQCGEGGVIVTSDDDLAAKMRAFINHGEHATDRIGLNLRMPEVSAAIALAQLRRGKELVEERREQALAILDAIGEIPNLRKVPPYRDATHVFYTIPFLIDRGREAFCSTLREAGVPIVEGYVDPLYRMSAFSRWHRTCRNAEELHDHRLFYIENCAYTFTKKQIGLIGDAFKRAGEQLL